jgi:hypothetical protein
MDLFIPDAKSKLSFKVLPFLLKTPLKRGQKCGKTPSTAVLRQLVSSLRLDTSAAGQYSLSSTVTGPGFITLLCSLNSNLSE